MGYNGHGTFMGYNVWMGTLWDMMCTLTLWDIMCVFRWPGTLWDIM